MYYLLTKSKTKSIEFHYTVLISVYYNLDSNILFTLLLSKDPGLTLESTGQFSHRVFNDLNKLSSEAVESERINYFESQIDIFLGRYA